MDISWINNFDPLVATFLMSMLPIFELRAAIPIAIANFNLSLWQIFIVAVIGSFIPSLAIIYWLGPIAKYFRRWKVFDKFFSWLFARTRAKFSSKYELWGNLALMFFVAVPLPGTGVWTGSLAAWLFGFNKRTALTYVGLGAIAAGIIVTLISVGAFKVFYFVNR